MVIVLSILSQLGIKTNDSGEYYLDETVFNKTLDETPEYFNALKDNNFPRVQAP